MEQFVSDPRLDKLVDGIVRLSSGDLTARLEISPARDSIDAVISGVNLLAEELNVMYQDLEKRVEERTAMLREAQVELQRMATTDDLTGLANRALLSERMSQEVQAAAASGKPPALIFLDLDTFKDVNDSLGHAAGDRVLVEVARRLKAVVRAADTVASCSRKPMMCRPGRWRTGCLKRSAPPSSWRVHESGRWPASASGAERTATAPRR